MVAYRILADLIVILHAAYVGFVVLGLAAILIGVVLRWNWVRNFWFRAAHLAAIAVVAIKAIAGQVCPLTTLENALREMGGQTRYPGDFVGYWAHELIFFEGPPWVFTACYVVITLLVLALYLLAPPCLPWERDGS
jgi:hypothetical protein